MRKLKIHLAERKSYSAYLCNGDIEYNPKSATVQISKVTCENCLKLIDNGEY